MGRKGRKSLDKWKCKHCGRWIFFHTEYDKYETSGWPRPCVAGKKHEPRSTK